MSAPWMPLYIADYLADTTQLTTAEHGAYLLLIMTYWRQGGLPDDDAMLARITRMTPKEWTRAKPVLAAFFQAGWKHSRIEKELEKSARKSEARAESGSRGGTAKALKNNDVTIANATILPQQKTDFALASSSLSQSDKIEKERNARDALSIGFEYFWNEWPNKVGKPAAQKSYARAFKEFGADVIYHGMRRYVADKPPDRPWLNPSTFLNQERFNDRPAVVQARASPNRMADHFSPA